MSWVVLDVVHQVWTGEERSIHNHLFQCVHLSIKGSTGVSAVGVHAGVVTDMSEGLRDLRPDEGEGEGCYWQSPEVRRLWRLKGKECDIRKSWIMYDSICCDTTPKFLDTVVKGGNS